MSVRLIFQAEIAVRATEESKQCSPLSCALNFTKSTVSGVFGATVRRTEKKWRFD